MSDHIPHSPYPEANISELTGVDPKDVKCRFGHTDFTTGGEVH